MENTVRADGIRVHKPITMELFRIACGHQGKPGVMRDFHHDLLHDAHALATAKQGDIWTWVVRESGTHLWYGAADTPEVKASLERLLDWTSRVQIYEIVVVDTYERLCAAFLRPVTAYNDQIDWRQPERGVPLPGFGERE